MNFPVLVSILKYQTKYRTMENKVPQREILTMGELYRRTFLEVCEKSKNQKEASERLGMCVSTFRKHCLAFGVTKFNKRK